MATANETDMSILATDTTFGNRVLESVEKFCAITVQSEAITAATVRTHEARVAYAQQVTNNPTFYKPLFVSMVSANQIVANDATANGTLVGMTQTAVATAAAAVLDSDIDNAVAAGFNALAGLG